MQAYTVRPPPYQSTNETFSRSTRRENSRVVKVDKLPERFNACIVRKVAEMTLSKYTIICSLTLSKLASTWGLFEHKNVLCLWFHWKSSLSKPAMFLRRRLTGRECLSRSQGNWNLSIKSVSQSKAGFFQLANARQPPRLRRCVELFFYRARMRALPGNAETRQYK